MTTTPVQELETEKLFYSDSQKQRVYDELQEILGSSQFANAPTASAFLDYIVNEHVAGHDENINAYTIATEGLKRSDAFDPASDTIIRTTAGRVRKALQTYYTTRDTAPLVVIGLPKGGYIPSFDFREPSASRPSTEQVPKRPVRAGILQFRTPIFASILILMMIGLFSLLAAKRETEAGPRTTVIDVRSVGYNAPQAKALAQELDLRLALALSRIGAAAIIPPSRSFDEDITALPSGNSVIPFLLETTVIDGDTPKLLWKILDASSGQIVGAGNDPVLGTDANSLDLTADRLAFRILGMWGAVHFALERYYGNPLTKPTCISKGQISEFVEDKRTFEEIRNCLHDVVEKSPGNAAAWAVLSMVYNNRSRFYTAGNSNERALLVDQAEDAVEKAVLISPASYLTNVALMQLALRQGRIEDFDKLQREIRSRYPEDIFLHIRIATRLARLGRSAEALKIFERAEKEFGINLVNWSPGIAVAHYVAGDFEAARREIFRSPSNLRFVCVLKVAILGKLGLKEQAAPIIEQLVDTDPEFKETFYSWLRNLGWTKPLVHEIANGLAKAGLVVSETPLS